MELSEFQIVNIVPSGQQHYYWGIEAFQCFPLEEKGKAVSRGCPSWEPDVQPARSSELWAAPGKEKAWGLSAWHEPMACCCACAQLMCTASLSPKDKDASMAFCWALFWEYSYGSHCRGCSLYSENREKGIGDKTKKYRWLIGQSWCWETTGQGRLTNTGKRRREI